MVASVKRLHADAPFARYPARQVQGAGELWSRRLMFAAIAAFLLMSPMLLTNVGFHYGGAGGTIIEKMHPGTWLTVAAIGLHVISSRDPVKAIQDLVSHYALALYLVAWAILLVFTIVVQKAPFTPLIDTFFLPPLLYAMANRLSLADEGRFCILIHVIMCMNAILGLFEFKTGFRLTPDISSELGPDIAWRATAFLGHPLGNALLTGCYTLIVALSDRCHLRPGVAPLIVLLQLVGLVSFGGRASLVVTVLLLGVIVGVRFLRVLAGAPFSRGSSAVILIGIPFLVVGFVVVAQSGFFDQLLQRFVEDNGSAQARIAMLEMFRYINLIDLIVGPDPAYMWSLQLRLGIEYGIESFWISFLLQNGAIMAGIFFIALGLLTGMLIRMTRPSTGIVFLYFYFVASTSVSMSAKTPLFAVLVFMISVMMRPSLKAKGA